MARTRRLQKDRKSAGRRGAPRDRRLAKAPTGIQGLDEITWGGLPRGRPTLVCGAAGTGKTLLGMEFVARGVTLYNEPGVIFAFEETADELTKNVRSLGLDLDALKAEKKLLIEHIHVDPHYIEESGEYDLEGLFIQMGFAIDAVGAKRVMLDTIETLFSAFSNHAILRSELGRMFRWLKTKGVTAVITAERGEGSLTRQGLEEYVSDCVILLDHRVSEQVATRRIRVVKYRGSAHGTNEYPFLIDERGIEVLPVTSLELNHEVSDERISTGVKELDQMLDGGVFRGSSVLISGTAGTGKTSLAGTFAEASGKAGERCLYCAFEESPAQIMRNLSSIGLDLNRWVRRGLLKFHASRPTVHGLESHLAIVHKHVREFEPRMVVIDPITNLRSNGTQAEAQSMLLRLIDMLKSRQITAVFTSLTGASALEATDVGVSSIIDSWILLRNVELNAERNRVMYVLKSRGMAHSNQMREFLLTSRGIRLVEPYLGPGGVLTGSSRVAQESRERAEAQQYGQAADMRQRQIERRRATVEAQITALRAELEADVDEIAMQQQQDRAREDQLSRDRAAMAARRAGGRGK